MPVHVSNGLSVDYTDDGNGPPVILVHSGGSNNRQWAALIGDLKHRYRLLAINLRGIGKSTPWPLGEPQTMKDQSVLVCALAEMLDGPVTLIGHSLGGAVVMDAALSLGSQVQKLILIEPNPFHLLAMHGREEEFAEIVGIRERFEKMVARQDWDALGEMFIDYWFGEGSWARMDEPRRVGVMSILPALNDTWGACLDETTPVEAWADFAARILIITATNTRNTIKGIREIMLDKLPGMHQVELPEGGHMAAVVRPDLVNPVIAEFLDAD